MATAIKPTDVLFLDTSYALALSIKSDQFHGEATKLVDELERIQSRFVTTRAVLREIGNALARLRYRSAAVRLLRGFERDPAIEVVAVDDDLYERALRLYSSRSDKEWGLIDCVSFVVMSDRGIEFALTADEHFQQCGFRALLRE